MKPTSYWWEAAPPRDLEPVALPAETDAVVVGAGYAGLAAALTLARAGRRVLVLEAGRPGEAASSLSGGMAIGEVKMGFADLIGKYGLDGAKALIREGEEAGISLERFVAEERIDCGYAKVGWFYAAHTPRDYEALGRQADLLRKHTNIDAAMVPRSEQHGEIGSDAFYGGEVRSDIAGLHPGQLHQGILERALAAGVAIAASTPLTGLSREKDGVTVATPRGTVRARDVIIATNGYTGGVTPWLRRRVIPIRSQVVVTEPLAPGVMDRLMPRRRMFVDSRRLHNYFRPTPDGTRILLGGRAGATDGDPARSCTHVQAALVDIFPELASVPVSHAWAGFTGYTFDHLPHIGVHDGIHFAMGFCGGGVVWAPWLGRKVALKVLGSPQAETLFDTGHFPTRPLYDGRPWFLRAVMAYYGLLDRLRV
jgi:glycine/D-amino acid oxidase-like deaminating enzyme